MKLPETAEEWRAFLAKHAHQFDPATLAELQEAVEALAAEEAGQVHVG